MPILVASAFSTPFVSKYLLLTFSYNFDLVLLKKLSQTCKIIKRIVNKLRLNGEASSFNCLKESKKGKEIARHGSGSDMQT